MAIEQDVAHARNLYKKGDYSRALTVLDRAIRCSHPDEPVALLDQRAACHARLNLLPAALIDARSIIKNAKQDATGYLRAGKILTAMKKQDLALKAYAHGLKCANRGRGHDQLQVMHDKLLAEVEPDAVRKDPFTSLPTEVMYIVLDYLTFRQRIVLSRVSKGWAAFVRSEPSMWQHLDLSQARVKVRNKFISHAINIGRSRLSTVTLHRLHDCDKALIALCKHCPIEQLTLLDTGLQKQSILEALKPASHLRMITITTGTRVPPHVLGGIIHSLAAKLEALHVHQDHGGCPQLCGMPALRHLSLKFPDMGPLLGFRPPLDPLRPGAIIKQIPRLESLLLHQTSHDRSWISDLDLGECAHLTRVDLRLSLLHIDGIALPPSIVSLRLDLPWAAPNFFSTQPADFSYDTIGPWGHMNQLISLELRMPSADIRHVVAAFQTGPPPNEEESQRPLVSAEPIFASLRQLDLHCFEVTPASLAALQRTLGHSAATLESFTLEQCRPPLDDLAFEHVVSIIGNARTLGLSGGAITGVSVKRIVTETRVESLTVNDCPQISRDAIDWSRAQGLTVEHKVSQLGQGGRKVRHGD